MVVLRPYRESDLEALYEICLVTGDSGQDASPLHNDRKVIGELYSAPYGVLEPEHVFVAEDDEGVAGYVVGTHDTAEFEARLEREWWPRLRRHYAGVAREGLTATDRMRVAAINEPGTNPADIVASYPAHIHMNLLPRLRGQRVGSELLRLWVEQAEAAGVSGIHLGANDKNAGGVAFWTKSGFEPLQTIGRTVWFGIKL
ncbi:GNAT family N-acetyltransferase [Devosia psychrophila]|uniref:Acetyltransferase n=1 Tax=Devosia psychrophila TaxID=728005 RepID=A0A0F5Q204_9HYPH|nr:GNAT family N-acetyltransferase [Devosia psychrophila]KKC34651.1 acetyltransferase [Devosia psychrophila]SFD01696.1 Acetyltransferase (GNAT) family protein [Devosia psychrophila]